MTNGNPWFAKLNNSTLDRPASMSIEGTIHRTGLLLLVMLMTAAWCYSLPAAEANPYIIGGALVGFVIALITVFTPNISPYTAPLYAVAEGLALGGISQIADQKYPGIAMQAVMGTGGVLGIMLVLYRFEILRATPAFIRGVIAATFGILIIYLADLILALFGIAMPIVNSHSGWGIAFSIGVCAIAALNLIIDFNQIEENSGRAPKFMEWYCAFGLLVTLVWLYLEILRLLQKVKSKN